MPTNEPTDGPWLVTDEVTIWHGDCLDVLRTIPDASVDAVVTDPPYGLEFMGSEWDAPWKVSDVNADAGFKGGGINATKNLPSFTGSTNPKCSVCKGTRRGRRDGTALVKVCLCEDGGLFPNVRATEMRAFQEWCEVWARECLRVLKPGGHMLAFGGSRTWHRLAAAVEDAGFDTGRGFRSRSSRCSEIGMATLHDCAIVVYMAISDFKVGQIDAAAGADKTDPFVAPERSEAEKQRLRELAATGNIGTVRR